MRKIPALVLLLALSTATARSAGPPSPAAGPTRTVTCAFSNPSYSGWCRVSRTLPRTGAQKPCRQVLACLNDVRCVANYCNATTIRGGWRLESTQVDSKKN
jgi:hypothetical protein